MILNHLILLFTKLHISIKKSKEIKFLWRMQQFNSLTVFRNSMKLILGNQNDISILK